MADKIPDISPNVDETMKELETHGSFELPVETYTDNCEIFRSLYNHWHKEMEIICIDKGNGLARLNRETLRLKEGDLLIVLYYTLCVKPSQVCRNFRKSDAFIGKENQVVYNKD